MIEDWIRKVIPEASFYYQGFDKPFIKDDLTDIRKEDYEQLCIILDNILDHKPCKMVNLFDPYIDYKSLSIEQLEEKAFFTPVNMFSNEECGLHIILARDI